MIAIHCFYTTNFYINRVLNTAIITVLDTLQKGITKESNKRKKGDESRVAFGAESCAIKYELL